MGCGDSKETVQETSSRPASVPTSAPSQSQSQPPAASNTTKVEKKVEFAPEPIQDRRKSSSNPPVKPILMSDLVPETNRFADIWDLGQVVGEGAFSVVRLARLKRDSNSKSAVKCISKKNLPKEDETALKQEVVILRALDHPNILKCLGFYDEEEMYYLVMEYMEGGELFDRIVKKTFYSEKEARDLVYILLSTIHYCHRHNVVHRDLKPENLLLSSLDDDAHVKLADFGFAIQSEGHMSLKTQCGTPGYVAPEILSTQPYGKAVDMWSIGVITYILLGGYPPFHDDNQKVLFQKIKNADYEFHPEYWDAVSHEAKDLISRLLKVNPLERYTSEEALNHSWITRDASELAQRSLDANLSHFKKFHATRKFKAAAKAIIATNRMKTILGGVRNAASAIEEEDAAGEDADRV